MRWSVLGSSSLSLSPNVPAGRTDPIGPGHNPLGTCIHCDVTVPLTAVTVERVCRTHLAFGILALGDNVLKSHGSEVSTTEEDASNLKMAHDDEGGNNGVINDVLYDIGRVDFG